MKEGEQILQFDYLLAYLDIYTGIVWDKLILGYPNFKRAREITKNYEKYPISHWKKLFDEINFLLTEYDDGKPPEQENVTDTANVKKAN